jgi:hypothetical protein
MQNFEVYFRENGTNVAHTTVVIREAVREEFAPTKEYSATELVDFMLRHPCATFISGGVAL